MKPEIRNYNEWKEQLDSEMSKAADGFVKIGYLLKVARDTDVLRESGYRTVAEFAKAEYGLEADVVSRYMAINDKYSENGYSERLAEKWQGYGVGKLQDMMNLPANVQDVIDKNMTRREVQEIAREYREEQQISDIEVAIEAAEQGGQTESNLYLLMKMYFEANTEEYLAACGSRENQELWLAGSGTRTIIGRLPGIGKLILTIKDSEQPVETVNMRTGGKEIYQWSELMDVCGRLLADTREAAREKYESVYGKTIQKPAEPEKPDSQQKQVKPSLSGKSEPKKEKKKRVEIVKPKPAAPPKEEKEQENDIKEQENEKKEVEKEQPYEDENARENKALSQKPEIEEPEYIKSIRTDIGLLSEKLDSNMEERMKLKYMLQIVDNLKWRIEKLLENPDASQDEETEDSDE